jgi:gamma-glutamylcyclotransferase
MPSTIYFGYGSNLWLEQMAKRCPSSKLLGLAKLDKWLWIISQRHYANIVASPDDHVYGLVFELTPEDEDELDVYEGVPTPLFISTLNGRTSLGRTQSTSGESIKASTTR